MPVSLIAYRYIPARHKKAFLIAISLLFIVWGNFADLLYLFSVIIFNFFTARQIERAKRRKKVSLAKLILASGISVNVLLLGYFKYFNFLREMFSLSKISFGIAVPLGISFVTFSLISFLCDIYRGDENSLGFSDFTLFVTFFPKITSGPILSYNDFTKMLAEKNLSRNNINEGVERFIFGLAKKVLLAGNLNLLFTAMNTASSRSFINAWLGALAYSFMLYFDFSGYSDMAIGLGKMFGYTMPENFDFPYISQNVGEFWRRWHISLGAFFRNYVYIPLGGNRKGQSRTIFNLFVVFALTGIWHGANYTFIFWGIYQFVFVALDKLYLDKKFEKLPKFARSLMTFIVITIGWVFFFSDSIGAAFRYLGNMFFIGTSGGGSYYLVSYIILLALAAFFSLPYFKKFIGFLDQRFKFFSPVKAIMLLLIFLLSVASIVSDSFVSFLYAAF